MYVYCMTKQSMSTCLTICLIIIIMLNRKCISMSQPLPYPTDNALYRDVMCFVKHAYSIEFVKVEGGGFPVMRFSFHITPPVSSSNPIQKTMIAVC